MADQAKLTYASGASSMTLDVLAVRGAAEPDSVQKFPGIIHEYLDGSLSEQNAGARQTIVVDFHLMTMLNRRKLVDWWLDTTRTIQSMVAAPGQPSKSGSASGSLNGSYKYKIVAVDNVGYSACGTVSGVITLAVEGCPLVWTASARARGYKIYRSIDPYTTWDLVDYSEINSYTDTGASVYKSDVTPPASASDFAVVVQNELEFRWGNETELERFATLEMKIPSIFTASDKFPV